MRKSRDNGMDTEKKQPIDRTAIFKKVRSILEPWLNNIEQSKGLNERTNLFAELGLDSVAILHLIFGVESEFNIAIKDHELNSDVFLKMANLIDIIESKLDETD